MKKSILFVVIALLGFPVLPRTALMETELTHKPRNARGIYSFGTYLDGTGRINLVNGNLVYGRRLISRPGRAGFNLDISIYYNSKIWDRNGNGMYVKDTGSWVGIGWYLGFARLVQGASSYALVDPDGSSHEIQQHDNGVWKSVDSTYIVLDVASKTATLKGGIRLVFGNTVGNTSYMTEMKDANGNKITATYVAGTGKLNEVFDSLGKAAAFSYNATTGCLETLTSYGTFRGTITFNTSAAGTFTPTFSVPKQVPSGERRLNSITFSLPDRNFVQNYIYYYLGEIQTITNRVEKDGQSITKTLADFTFGTRSYADPVYTSVEERVVTSRKDYTDGTQYYTTSLAYTFNGNGSNPSKTAVTDIRGITDYNFNYSVYPARSWSDGLISSMQRKNLSQTTVYRTQATDWEQDISAGYIVNPRPTRRTTTMDDGQSLKTELIYASDGTGNISQTVQYKYGNTVVLRRATTTYRHESNSAYTAANMTNLPAAVSVKDGSGTEVARTEYGYDEYQLTLYQGPVYNHEHCLRQSEHNGAGQSDERAA